MRATLLLQLALLCLECAAGLHIQPGNYGPCSYIEFVHTLDCSRASLDSVPTVDPSLTVKIFNLDYNAISRIEANAFANISANLAQLSIASPGQNITSIDSAAFEGLRFLRQLTVHAAAGNAGRMAPLDISAALAGLEALTTLQLKELNIASLPRGFVASNRLSTVELVRNAIATVDALAFANATQVQTLDMSENSVDQLAWLGSTPALRSLTLKSCGISTLGQLPAMPHLVTLNLASNKIKQLAANSLDNVAETLQELNLASNDIPDNAAPGLARLTALRQLHMPNNQQLSAVPGELRQLQRLELFDARNTIIEQLRPDSFHANASLATLYLDYTKIHSIYVACFANLKRLRSLSLSSATEPLNAVRVLLDDGSISTGNWSALLNSLPQLASLELKGTAMLNGGLNDTIWQAIEHLAELSKLTLSGNAIRAVPDFFLHKFGNLTSVDLSGNSIAAVSSATFYNAERMSVKLDGNNISRMDNCTLAMYSSAGSVSVTGNPFVCDCALQWLHRRLKAEGRLAGVSCSGPANFSGKAWAELDSASFCAAGETPPADCRVLAPTTATPTTTAFPYQLTVTLAKIDDSTVKLTANTDTLAGLFRAYVVAYGPAGQLARNTSEQAIAQTALVLSVQPSQLYTYCYLLLPVGGGAAVESAANCKSFTLAATSGLGLAAITGLVVGGVLVLLLVALTVCCLCRGRQEHEARLKSRYEDPYTYTYPDERHVSNGKYQPKLRPGSKRFSKRSVNNLASSRPSLATSTTTIATTRSSGFGVQNGLRQTRSQEFVLQPAPPLPDRHRSASHSRSRTESLDEAPGPYVEMRDPHLELTAPQYQQQPYQQQQYQQHPYQFQQQQHQQQQELLQQQQQELMQQQQQELMQQQQQELMQQQQQELMQQQQQELMQQQQQELMQQQQQQQYLQSVAFENSAFQRGGSCYEMGNF